MLEEAFWAYRDGAVFIAIPVSGAVGPGAGKDVKAHDTIRPSCQHT